MKAFKISNKKYNNRNCIELEIEKDFSQITTIEELKEYYHDYDCFFDWTEWNLSEIREIKNEK